MGEHSGVDVGDDDNDDDDDNDVDYGEDIDDGGDDDDTSSPLRLLHLDRSRIDFGIFECASILGWAIFKAPLHAKVTNMF